MTGATLLAGALSVVTLTASRASATFSFTRLGGTDRYDTGRVVAEATFASSGQVLLATGEQFPDALSGGYAAGLSSQPILLTTTAALSTPTAQALQDLKTGRVVILGGPDAVSTAVETDLQSRGYSTSRIQGTDRYDTARQVAESGGPGAVGTIYGSRVALLASGEDAHFPDALSASPLSFAKHFPTFLTTTDTLSPAARQGLTDLGIKGVIVIGGPAAVSQTVVDQVQQMGLTVYRIGGQDRTDTAARVADFERSSMGFGTTHVDLARGDLFPDSLTGGVHAGHETAPVLLTENPSALGPYTSNWLAANAKPLNDGHIFGGDAAVTASTQSDAENIVRTNSVAPSSTTTTTTGSRPPMHFDDAAATAGAGSMTVHYSNAALCPSVDSNASDFNGAVTAGPNPQTFSFAGASCTNLLNQTVTLTLPSGVRFVSGQTVQVTARAGDDGNTVSDAVGDNQPVGDFITTVVP